MCSAASDTWWCVHAAAASLSFSRAPDASPEAWADLVGVSPVQALSLSPPPSPGNTPRALDDDEGDEHSAGSAQQQQQGNGPSEQVSGKQPPPAAAAGADSSDSSTPSSADAAKRALLQRSARLRGAVDTARVSNGAAEQQQAAAGGAKAAPLVPPDGSASQGAPDSSASSPPAPPTCAVSFLVLADPRFGQVRELLGGLDFAFPESAKVSWCGARGCVGMRGEGCSTLRGAMRARRPTSCCPQPRHRWEPC
jgi:hypothetical protein